MINNILFKTVIPAFLITSFIPAAFASQDISSFRDQSRQEMKLGHIAEALRSVTQGIKTLESEFTPNKVVAEIQTELQELRQEVVVSNINRVSTEKLSIETFIESLFGFGGRWNNSSIDVTKIVTINPKEVAQFPQKVQEDLNTLKLKVHRHIETYINEIVMSKYLLIEAYRMIAATDSNQWTSKITKNDLNEIDSFVQTYKFKGLQNVTACITTDYTDHVSHSDRGESLNIGLIFFKIGYLNQKINTETFKAHTEKTCTFTQNEINETTSPYLVVDLGLLDQKVEEWKTAAHLKLQYSNDQNINTSVQEYQTWGLE